MLLRYLLILSSIFFIACSSSKKIASYPIVTVALPNSEEGTILIRSSGQGESESTAVSSAEKKAFNTLLFYGFPSSVQVRPLIENEEQAKRANGALLTGFFDNKEYANFIVNAFNYSAPEKSGKYYYLNRDIKINIRSLRTYLENKGLIRKFGY